MCKVNIWDFSGYKEFLEVRNEFYKEVDAIVLCYDVTSGKSFEALDMWMREAKKCGADKPLTIVCGTKKDLSGRRDVSESDARSWASSKKCRYFEVSSKENKGITELFSELISICLR